MLDWFRSRTSLSAAVTILYLAPFLAIVGFSLLLPSSSFGMFSIGLLLIATGSLLIHSLIAGWTEQLQLKVAGRKTEQSSEPLQEEQENAYLSSEEIDLKNAEIKSLIESQEEYATESRQSLDALTHENESLVNQIAHKEHLLEQSESTIAELRAAQDRKQQRINQLESKVRDLSYEIKTLLHLTEIPESSVQEESSSKRPELSDTPRMETRPKIEKKMQPGENATALLKRCIDIAQKMTGASHYSSNNSRFRGIPVDNFALDMRCLFDSLHSENGATVLFYSVKENKLLFANEQTRKLTGWTPDKFVQNFENIIQEGKEEWSNALKQLSVQSESKVRLILKSRSGEDILVHGLLGAVPTGIFRHHVLAILFNADHRQALSSNT